MSQQQVGRYQILDEIASGGQARVYLAYDQELERNVALKILHQHLSLDPQYVDRFLREARLAASVSHANVVTIYEVGQENGQHFIAMESLPWSLDQLLQERGRLSIDEAVYLASQIASGVQAAHEKGIIHRDLKPQNVLLATDGTPKVSDFGIAWAMGLSNLTATGVVMGTPQYMSPEQARGEPAQVQSDVYSLGCLLYRLLAGDAPFKGETPLAIIRQHIDETPRALEEIRPEVPQQLSAVVERSMAKSAASRFQSMAELTLALQGISNGHAQPVPVGLPTRPSGPATPTPQLPTRTVSESREPFLRPRLWYLKRGALLFSAVVLVGLVAAGGIFFTRQGAVNVHGSNTESQRVEVLQQEASQFTAELLDGRTLALDDLRGKVVLVDFWASWCTPCQQEAPTLANVYLEYAGQPVEFLGINIWDRKEDALEYMEIFGIPYPIGIDEQGTIATAYKVRGIPEKFIIDQQGIVRQKHVGPMDPEVLRAALNELLVGRTVAATPTPVDGLPEEPEQDGVDIEIIISPEVLQRFPSLKETMGTILMQRIDNTSQVYHRLGNWFPEMQEALENRDLIITADGVRIADGRGDITLLVGKRLMLIDAPGDPAPVAGALFTVTSTADFSDTSRGDGTCATPEGVCTLRSAIEEANSREDVDTIEFNIPESDPGFDPITGAFSIQPSADGLPTIRNPAVIDGYTQPGASPDTNPMTQGIDAVLKIELDGSNVGPNISALVFNSGGSVVRGLVINRFSDSSIRLKNKDNGNRLVGNFIGTDVTGTVPLGNKGDGISVEGPNNTIGGTTPEARNVISGNLRDGVLFVSRGSKVATNNVLLGNLIGTDASGTVGLGNGSDGVGLDGASANFIGGTEPGAGNVISNSRYHGIRIRSGASHNVISGNLIGTDVTGTASLGNKRDGVKMEEVAEHNIVGGTTIGSRNVISGNALNGITIQNPEATGNIVQGNFIGTDITGASQLANLENGIVLNGAVKNAIGGTTRQAKNIISGNGKDGIDLRANDNQYAMSNVIHGNFIGTDATGAAVLGNGRYGVHLNGSSGNIVGGSDPGAGNVISGNETHGIRINKGANNNVVEGNLIGTDVTGKIALGNINDGVNIEGAHDNTIGGTTPGAGNIISGNGRNGVLIQQSDSVGNLVQGNYIGTDITGKAALGNVEEGIVIYAGVGNVIGGTDPQAKNLISGNGRHGILIREGATSNLVQGNIIGTDMDGTEDLGNGLAGILIRNSTENTIGGSQAGAENLILYNPSGKVVFATDSGN